MTLVFIGTAVVIAILFSLTDLTGRIWPDDPLDAGKRNDEY